MIVIVVHFCHHDDVYRFLMSQNEWVVPAGAILPEPDTPFLLANQ